MSRARAIALVLVVWAAIYLPRLGSLEIKSEEGRRILPAVTMLRPQRRAPSIHSSCRKLGASRISGNRRW